MRLFFAELFSYLFHPTLFFLMMPFFVVYRQTESELYALKWFIFSSAFVFIGIVILLVGRLRGNFSDFDLSKREERFKFYIFSLILAFLYLAVALTTKGLLFPISIISLGISLGIVFFIIINHYIKASIHVAVACAFVVTMGFLYGPKIALGIVWLVPFLVWSRITLKKHTASEIIAGGLLGSAIVLLTLIIGKGLYTNLYVK